MTEFVQRMLCVGDEVRNIHTEEVLVVIMTGAKLLCKTNRLLAFIIDDIYAWTPHKFRTGTLSEHAGKLVHSGNYFIED